MSPRDEGRGHRNADPAIPRSKTLCRTRTDLQEGRVVFHQSYCGAPKVGQEGEAVALLSFVVTGLLLSWNSDSWS